MIYSLQACKRKSIQVQCIFTLVIYKRKQFLFPESSGCWQRVVSKHLNSEQCNCLVPSINRNTGSLHSYLSLPGCPRAKTQRYTRSEIIELVKDTAMKYVHFKYGTSLQKLMGDVVNSKSWHQVFRHSVVKDKNSDSTHFLDILPEEYKACKDKQVTKKINQKAKKQKVVKPNGSKNNLCLYTRATHILHEYNSCWPVQPLQWFWTFELWCRVLYFKLCFPSLNNNSWLSRCC